MVRRGYRTTIDRSTFGGQRGEMAYYEPDVVCNDYYQSVGCAIECTRFDSIGCTPYENMVVHSIVKSEVDSYILDSFY